MQGSGQCWGVEAAQGPYSQCAYVGHDSEVCHRPGTLGDDRPGAIDVPQHRCGGCVRAVHVRPERKQRLQ
eukprot:12763290-Alexandrium_andersonii.AAC.1